MKSEKWWQMIINLRRRDSQHSTTYSFQTRTTFQLKVRQECELLVVWFLLAHVGELQCRWVLTKVQVGVLWFINQRSKNFVSPYINVTRIEVRRVCVPTTFKQWCEGELIVRYWEVISTFNRFSKSVQIDIHSTCAWFNCVYD